MKSLGAASESVERIDVGIVVVLLLTLLVAGAPAPADATGIRITVTSPVPHRRPNDIHHGPVGDHIHRRPDVIHRAPVVVVPQPVYITGPAALLQPRLLGLQLGPPELGVERLGPRLLQLGRPVGRGALRAPRVHLGVGSPRAWGPQPGPPARTAALRPAAARTA